MARTVVQSAALGLGCLALLCWAVMFLAGTDVWRELGRPDFWHRAGPPYQDLRAFACAFYLLLAVLSVHVIVAAVDLATSRAGTGKSE
jgi:hypothetical protein